MAVYGGKSYSWEGKQLVEINVMNSLYYTFAYDENGLRTSKTKLWISGGTEETTEYFYNFKAASARWKVWEYSVGVKANVIDGGGAVEIGLEHTNFSLSAGKTTYTVNGGVNRLGITIANDVDWKNNTAGNYTQYYIRPITVVPAAVGVCAAVSYVGPAVIGTLAALLSGPPALLPA